MNPTLPPILTLDKALHQEARLNVSDSNSTNVFTQPAPEAAVSVRVDGTSRRHDRPRWEAESTRIEEEWPPDEDEGVMV